LNAARDRRAPAHLATTGSHSLPAKRACRSSSSAAAPAEKQHAPWVARVRGQLAAAFTELEAASRAKPLACNQRRHRPGGVSCAVTWFFVRELLPELAHGADHPALQAHSDRRTPARVQPGAHGDGIVAS